MLKWLGKLLDSNERELKKLEPQVAAINKLKPKAKKLKEEDFAAKTAEFKKRFKNGESLDDLLVEAFALVREASVRTIGLRPFDVQLMAAAAFHQGKVAEQKTGEGKTLSAVPALYLNALTGRGCHLVTVNDYLARRDTGWMGPIFQLLGLSVGVIYSGEGEQPALIYDPKFTDSSQHDDRLAHLKKVDRKQAYAADITYGTNNEFGFDYLRDNMVADLSQMVQRSHHFAIVDEVDSILIDEARTPLIISAPDTEPTDKYYKFAQLIKELSQDTDYIIDEKLKTANLTEHGLTKVEKRLGVDNLYEKDFETIHHIENALKAKTLYLCDRDYIVKEDQVIIVDEFTGRLMFGRRWSEGLHQAVEAKEGVAIQQESKTLATISFQNYFRMYEKLAGMTGTAATEAEEFNKIYGLEVLVVPTHKEMIRHDHPDMVYKTVRAKYAAIGEEIAKNHKKGQPVLVGTTSIEKNQIVHQLLQRKKIPHEVLNAKNHEREAQIIADAGKVGSVTIATNLAGRGVDIILGGAKSDKPLATSKKNYKKELEKWEKEHAKVVNLGGLYVIGTERHESRRIDNQLRGRSGRQGDPGKSRFFVSLEDDLMRLFGGEQIARLMTTFKMPENIPLEHGMVSRAIKQAQVKVEGFNFDMRKRVVEYDDVMNKQREIIYKRRRKILEMDKKSGELKEKILENLKDDMANLVSVYAPEGFEKIEYETIVQEFIKVLPFDKTSQMRLRSDLERIGDKEKITQTLQKIVEKGYEGREKQLGGQLMREIERFVTLRTIDELWMDHLDAIDDLREGIGLRGYAQRDPLVEYKAEAFNMFEQLVGNIDYEIGRKIFRIQVAVPEQKTPTNIVLGRQDIASDLMPQDSNVGPDSIQQAAGVVPLKAVVKPVISGKKKIGRNDPCPCGAINPNTGRPYKYKQCGLINAPHHRG